MDPIYVHATLTIRSGAAQRLNEAMGELLPHIAKLGWELASSYNLMTGPTATLLNVWKIPDANAFLLLPQQLRGDPEAAAILERIQSCLESNVLMLMTPHAYPKPRS